MKHETYRKYPGFAQTQVDTVLDEHVENLRIQGFSVMEGVISRDRALKLEKRLDELYLEQEKEFGKDRLLELGEYWTLRDMLVRDPQFAELVENPRVLDVIYALLGDTAILNLQNASAAFPGVKHFQSSYHRDFAKDFVATSPLSVNAFWCITDFTESNGATEIIPFTHRLPVFPSAKYLEKNLMKICVPAGSVIFWDSLLLHRAGFNSTDQVRYGINHMYTRPFIKQQMDFPHLLKGLYPVESKLGQLLGFWSIPPKSIKEFRVNPEDRTYRPGQG